MPETEEQKADLSSTLLWTLTTPIDNISPENSGAIVQWLEDRSKVASSFNTVITASLVLFTLRKRDRSDIAKSGDFSACPYCQ